MDIDFKDTTRGYRMFAGRVANFVAQPKSMEFGIITTIINY